MPTPANNGTPTPRASLMHSQLYEGVEVAARDTAGAGLRQIASGSYMPSPSNPSTGDSPPPHDAYIPPPQPPSPPQPSPPQPSSPPHASLPPIISSPPCEEWQDLYKVDIEVNEVGFDWQVAEIDINDRSILCLLKDRGMNCRLPKSDKVVLTFRDKKYRVAFLGNWHRLPAMGVIVVVFTVLEDDAQAFKQNLDLGREAG